jgi:hypothetical protein
MLPRPVASRSQRRRHVAKDESPGAVPGTSGGQRPAQPDGCLFLPLDFGGLCLRGHSDPAGGVWFRGLWNFSVIPILGAISWELDLVVISRGAFDVYDPGVGVGVSVGVGPASVGV